MPANLNLSVFTQSGPNSDMSHPGASHKSISIADQSKTARHVMLVLSAKGRPDIFSH
jgi:hypothetical protein